jgi:hypothetical protein
MPGATAGVKIDGIPGPRPGSADDGPGQAAQDGGQNGSRQGAGRAPDQASTRRKSVVFEEDDELDVPDFLK